jgi:uncharacterized metal-binding protein
VSHRSWVSHGAIVGPIARLVYFLAVLYGVLWAGLWVVYRWLVPLDRNTLMRSWRREFVDLVHGHPRETALILAGFVIGGLVHTAADVIWSSLRPRRRRRRR